MFNRAKLFVLKNVKNPYLRSAISQLKVSLNFPSLLYFELSANCNYACRMCPQSYRKTPGQQLMSFDLFKKGIDESLKYGPRTGLFFHKRGEPLLNPNAVDMIEYACKNKAAYATHLSTNGFFLTEAIAERLITSGLQSISISIDAVDRATFKKVKGVDCYDKVVENVEKLIRLKKAMHSKTPMVRPKFIPMNANKGQVRAFKERWRHADDVIIADFIFWPDYNEAGMEFNGKMADLAANICTFPWSSLVVNYDGSVTMCCNDFDDKLLIGNLNAQSIYEVWHSPKLGLMRKEFLKGNKNLFSICASCNYFDRKKSFANSCEQFFTKTVLRFKGC